MASLLTASEVDIGQKTMTEQQDVAELEDLQSPITSLPIEILTHIFVLCSCYCFAQLPYFRGRLPYQLVISHVCSNWRQIALNTAELWNKVEIVWLSDRPNDRRTVSVYRVWVSRAGGRPLNVKLGWRLTGDAYNDFVMPYRVKKLNIILPYEQLIALSNLDLDVEELAITFPEMIADTTIIAPPFISRARSVTFSRFYRMLPEDFDGLSKVLRLPWHQLRVLQCDPQLLSLSTWLNVLRQTPLLEECHLNICRIGGNHLQAITTPNLQRLTIGLRLVHPDTIIPLIVTPKLTNLEIYSPDTWSEDTYSIIKKHYKLNQLERLRLEFTQFPLRVIEVLKDAPMIRALSLEGMPILDNEARKEFASGRVGRLVTELRLYGCNDSGQEWLDMVEARQKNVYAVLQSITNWRESFTSLKQVKFWGVKNKDAYEDRVAALRLLGVDVGLF